ncbi:hypothetical protein RCL1_000619 [Eukaryota sp. TZLM3-RCL]
MQPIPDDSFTLFYNNTSFNVRRSVLKTKSSLFRTFFDAQLNPDLGDVYQVPTSDIVSLPIFQQFVQFLNSDIVQLTVESSYPLYYLAWYFGVADLVENTKTVIKRNISKNQWFETVSQQIALNNDALFMKDVAVWLKPLLRASPTSSSAIQSKITQTAREWDFVQHVFTNMKQEFEYSQEQWSRAARDVRKLFQDYSKVCVIMEVKTWSPQHMYHTNYLETTERFAIIQNWPKPCLFLSLNQRSFGHCVPTCTVDPHEEGNPKTSDYSCTLQFFPFATVRVDNVVRDLTKEKHRAYQQGDVQVTLHGHMDEQPPCETLQRLRRSFWTNKVWTFELLKLEAYSFTDVNINLLMNTVYCYREKRKPDELDYDS